MLKPCPLFLFVTTALFAFCSLPADDEDHHDLIQRRATEIEDKVIAWRRDIHQHPELSNREFRTASKVADHLRSLGLEVQTEVAHTGVVGLLEGSKEGPVVALRADMDALPVVEEVDLPFASKVKSTYNGQEVGVMHACGHDTHVAILMGAAEVLSGMREQIEGSVKFIFQPAEEGAPEGEEGGAGLMVRQGVMENPTVDAIFGLHIGQGFETGKVAFRPKAMLAAAEKFEIHVTGSQTHAAAPWNGIDPIVTSAQIINALQTIVSRQVNINVAPAVITVGMIQGGVRNNIIPERVRMIGTVRTFAPEMRTMIHERMRRTIKGVADSAGAKAELILHPGIPVTYNDPALVTKMAPTLARVYGSDNIREANRVTGYEDFSFYQKVTPGFFFFIGGRPPNVLVERAIPNHSPRFYIDEAALLPAVRAMAGLALDYLETEAGR